MENPKSPMLFDCFNPDCGTALIVAVAEALSAGLDDGQMNVLGTFLTAVADIISYMAAQRQHNENTCPGRKSSSGENDEGGDDNDGGKEEAGSGEDNQGSIKDGSGSSGGKNDSDDKESDGLSNESCSGPDKCGQNRKQPEKDC